MLQFKCPKGHLYGIGGYGEDLSWNIVREGTIEKCPQCKGEAIVKITKEVTGTNG